MAAEEFEEGICVVPEVVELSRPGGAFFTIMEPFIQI